MSPREWIAATWAEWAPTLGPGRFELGPLILMTRSELARTATAQQEIGAYQQRVGLRKAARA